MVQPVPPNITEPLSVCSRRVRLDGMGRGAVVELRGTGGRQLGRWTATWPDELFDLDPGVQLKPGELVWARQTSTAGEVSGWTTYPQATQEATPSTPMFDLPVVACAQEVSVSAVTPGSVVTVIDQVAKIDLGSSRGGIAENIKLSRVVDPLDVLQLQATPCGGVPGLLSAVAPVERLRTVSTGDRRLPQVELDLPLRACQRLLTVRRGQPGTKLVLQRGDGSRLGWSLHAGGEETLRVDELHENEDVQWWVTQNSIGCDVLDSDPATATVGTAKPPRPRIVTAPCPGSPQLQLSGLVKSATVRLGGDGVDARELVASADTTPMDVGDLGLALGQVLTVVQRLCNDWSDPSPDIAVTAAWDRQPTIVEPLESCSTVVVVADVSPGALVMVLDEGAGTEGELARAVADATTVSVDVAPLLPDHTIVVKVLGCRPADLKALVQADQERMDPFLLHAYVGTRTAVVTQVSAGTRVDVSVNGHHAGFATAAGTTVDVTLQDALADGDMVEVLARRCNIPRSARPRPAEPLPVPAYALHQPGGADCGGGNWASGRVEAIVATPGDVLVLGCTNSGVWISHPDGSAEPVSMSWPSAEVVAMVTDPTNVMHVFAATKAGLHETDPTAPDPLHTWRDVPLPTALTGVTLKTVVVTDQRVVVVAGSRGVAWSPIPAPGAVWAMRDDPSMQLDWTGAAAGPAGSVVLAAASIQPPPPVPGTPPGTVTPGVLMRGEWSPSPGTFTWTNNAATAPAAFTARMGRTVMTSSPADRNHLYALAADGSVDPGAATLQGLLHSDDGGRTWACHHYDPNDLNQFAAPKPWDMGRQAGLDLAVAAHPTDPAKVLIAARNERLLGSTDSGATFDSAGYPRVLGPTFHADNRALAWDASTGQLRVLVGGDGGIYVSTDTDGHAFNSSRSRGLSTLMVDADRASSMASAAAIPGSCCIGLQDNDEAATTAGSVWRQKPVGGDGKRQVVVGGRYLLHSGNDSPPLQWSEVTPAGVGPSHEVRRPPPGLDGSLPTFESFVSAVVAPSWRDTDGHLLVAYIAEVVSNQPRLYGIFDDPGAGDGRFFGVQLSVLPDIPKGVASFDGRTVVVATQKYDGLIPHVYRFDAATGSLLESVIPKPGGPSEVWGPVMTGPHSGAAIQDFAVLVSDDLQVWAPPTGQPGGAALPLPPVEVIAADLEAHPPALHVGTDSLVAVVRDEGALVTVATGLPVNSQTKQLSVVTDANGDRWVYLGSYGWSVWRARLP